MKNLEYTLYAHYHGLDITTSETNLEEVVIVNGQAIVPDIN